MCIRDRVDVRGEAGGRVEEGEAAGYVLGWLVRGGAGVEEVEEVVPCPNHLEKESTALVVFHGRGVTSLTSLCHWTTC